MRKSMKTLSATAVLIAGIAAASALYAHDSESSKAHDRGMMGSGMMGMMNMMEEMSGMMDRCNQMMQGMADDGTSEPNEQWRKEAPALPDQSN